MKPSKFGITERFGNEVSRRMKAVDTLDFGGVMSPFKKNRFSVITVSKYSS